MLVGGIIRIESSLNVDAVELTADVVDAVGGVAIDVAHKRVLVVVVVVIRVVAIFVPSTSLEPESIDNWRAAILWFWQPSDIGYSHRK